MRNKSKNPFLTLSKSLNVMPFSTEELVFDHAGLTEIGVGDLALYPNLMHLYIPFNRLKVLNNLEKNIRITYIDARNNLIEDINVPKQVFLEDLMLSNNNLQDLELFLSKITHLKNLKSLDLRGNPLTLEKAYRLHVIQAFPELKILDGLEITKQERIKSLSIISKDMTTNNKTHVRPKTSMSVLQILRNRPLSSADSIVHEKAKRIRAASELKQKMIEEEKFAAAKKQREEFETAYRNRVAPLPDFLRQDDQKNAGGVKEKDAIVVKPKRRPTSRMYFKRPIYTSDANLTEVEERFHKFNPGIPPVYTRLTSQIAYS